VNISGQHSYHRISYSTSGRELGRELSGKHPPSQWTIFLESFFYGVFDRTTNIKGLARKWDDEWAAQRSHRSAPCTSGTAVALFYV